MLWHKDLLGTAFIAAAAFAVVLVTTPAGVAAASGQATFTNNAGFQARYQVTQKIDGGWRVVHDWDEVPGLGTTEIYSFDHSEPARIRVEYYQPFSWNNVCFWEGSGDDNVTFTVSGTVWEPACEKK